MLNVGAVRGRSRGLFYCLVKLLAAALAICLASCSSGGAPDVSVENRARVDFGVVNGASLHCVTDCLAGAMPRHLPRIDEPETQRALHAILVEARGAGVNWIRLLLGANWMEDGYPVPSRASVRALSVLVDMIRSYDMRVELVFVGWNEGGRFLSAAKDAAYIAAYMDVVADRVDLLLVGADLFMCDPGTLICADEAGADPVRQNHGDYMRAIWHLMKARYPGVPTGVAFIAASGVTSLAYTSRSADWVVRAMPDAGTLYASLYLPPAPTAEEQAEATRDVLRELAATGLDVFIDEFGVDIGLVGDAAAVSYYEGTLSATCGIPRVAWTLGPDRHWYALLRGIDPVVTTSAWEVVRLHYTRAC